MTPLSASAIVSPCVRLCELDARKRQCLGCLRTLDEIISWGRLSNAERLRIMDDLKRRQAASPPLAPSS